MTSDPGRALAPVVRLAPAKVNLTLAVLGTRPDGFHDLHSVFVPLDLADRLSVAVLPPGAADTLHVDGFDPGPPADNLVLRAIGAAPRGRIRPGAARSRRRRWPPASRSGSRSPRASRAGRRTRAAASTRRSRPGASTSMPRRVTGSPPRSARTCRSSPSVGRPSSRGVASGSPRWAGSGTRTAPMTGLACCWSRRPAASPRPRRFAPGTRARVAGRRRPPRVASTSPTSCAAAAWAWPTCSPVRRCWPPPTTWRRPPPSWSPASCRSSGRCSGCSGGPWACRAPAPPTWRSILRLPRRRRPRTRSGPPSLPAICRHPVRASPSCAAAPSSSPRTRRAAPEGSMTRNAHRHVRRPGRDRPVQPGHRHRRLRLLQRPARPGPGDRRARGGRRGGPGGARAPQPGRGAGRRRPWLRGRREDHDLPRRHGRLRRGQRRLREPHARPAAGPLDGPGRGAARRAAWSRSRPSRAAADPRAHRAGSSGSDPVDTRGDTPKSAPPMTTPVTIGADAPLHLRPPVTIRRRPSRDPSVRRPVRRTVAVVLAAGLGTRMRSATPKVLHRLCGRPMVDYVLDAAEAATGTRPLVVYSPATEAVREPWPSGPTRRSRTAARDRRRAARRPRRRSPTRSAEVLVLSGDVPLVRADLLAALLEARAWTTPPSRSSPWTRSTRPAWAGWCATRAAPSSGSWRRRTRPTTSAQIAEINAGLYAFDAAWLRRRIGDLRPSPVDRASST